MSLRRTIIEIDLDGLNVSEFCRAHGISRWFFYDLRRRVAADPDALEPRSRAPHHVANRTPDEVEDTIVALRKTLTDAGLDAGAASIASYLAASPMAVPSEGTIWRILTRRGFIEADPSKRPNRPTRSFAAERANECWQVDDTGWSLADGTAVKIINIIDDCSRVNIASVAVASCTAQTALDTFAAGAAEWGWPERFLSDNASEFRHGLTTALAELGIGAGHSRPYHPQTCGKVERFHQTLKRFLAAQTPPETLADLQGQLDQFRAFYNRYRPHRSLGRRPPAKVWADTPKSGPAQQPLTAPTRIHRSIANSRGVIEAGRNTRINLGAHHAGQHALAIITGTTAHAFIDGRLVRALTIDPNKRYQPLDEPPTSNV